MKRYLLIILLLAICGISSKAQGIVYQPFIPENNPALSYTPPTYIPRQTRRPVAPSASKISEQIVMTDVYDVGNDAIYYGQIKVTEWSDGDVFLDLVGLKSNDKWYSVKLGVLPIVGLLSEPELNDEAKSFLLMCNELAVGMAFSENKIYLVGLRRQEE